MLPTDNKNPLISYPFSLEKANHIYGKLTPSDQIAIQHFENAKYSELCDFFREFRKSCSIDYLIQGEFLDKSKLGDNFQLSQHGLNKILILLAARIPNDLAQAFKHGLKVEDQLQSGRMLKINKFHFVKHF